MIRTFLLLSASLVALVSASCCCTGEPKAPKLSKLPKFQEVPAAPQYEVEPTK